MTVHTLTLLCIVAVFSASPTSAEDLETNEDWVKAVRGSGSYQQGLTKVRDLTDRAYDVGALKGAKHWEDMRAYYISTARKKGCERGTPYAEGPVKACHQVTEKTPSLMGSDYRDGAKEVADIADETLHPDLVERALESLYDYGYVQGMKHGVRANSDSIRIKQTYYRSCMARVTSAKGEEACATGSRKWSDALIARVRKQLESHGLPAGKAP
jgi:hypothetical protein